MRRTLIGLAAIMLTTSAALAVGGTGDTSAGKAFVSDRGFTLYTLSSDKSNYSTCYAKCTKIWPPYRATAGAKYKRGWSIITRRDGTRMWAYKGHPLYTFFKDKQPGDAYGKGVHDNWGWWHVATISGSYASKPVASYTPKYKSGSSS